MFSSSLLIAAITPASLLVKKIFGHASGQLPVLMYHKISADGSSDDLTVRSTTLERHFNYLRREGFTPILLSQLIAYVKYNRPLPDHPVLITFDDGYRNNYTVMYPLLKKYEMKANIFLVPALFQDAAKGAIKEDGYLCAADIKSMDTNIVEFGLHSYNHRNYKHLSLAELDADIAQNKKSLQELGISFQPCLAYPYGAYPKGNPFKLHYFFETLTLNRIELAFRIGNRANPLPLINPLLVQRFDVRENTSFSQFAAWLQKCKPHYKHRSGQMPVPPLEHAFDNTLK